MKKNNTSRLFFKVCLFALLFSGFVLRFFGHNWDHGLQVHPDERAITMFAEKIHFFDQLDPNFFSYGSLPIYLLKGVSQVITTIVPDWTSTLSLAQIGRALSVFFDLGTAILVVKLAQRLFKNNALALCGLFFYVVAFFPIQNSHFYIVDVQLTFFVTLLLLSILRYMEKPSLKRLGAIGIVHGVCLAVKITPVIYIPFIVVILAIEQIKAHKKWQSRIVPFVRSGMVYIVTGALTYVACMPYSILNSTKYIHDMTEQLRLNNNPYEFPFTLQYVGTTPYLYYLKNIFLWGAGPFITLLALAGIILALRRYKTLRHQTPAIVFASYYAYYFIILGRSAVKFMRYMLPIYPFIAIMAGVAFYILFILNMRKQKGMRAVGLFAGEIIVLAGVFLWTVSFMTIYTQQFTRLTASFWIHYNIPKGSTLTYDGWDDGLPLMGSELYNHEELELYGQPDDNVKWAKLHGQLANSDYVIESSNRLYVPLQRLSDCSLYKNCFPITSQYFKKLLSNKLQTDLYKYQKVAEFAVYPTIPFSKELFGKAIYIDDQSADESFTVYDHPKVLIFKNILRNH